MNTRQTVGNRFEINDPARDLLGRGGMGDVYLGTDLHIGDRVAIKTLRPEVLAGTPDAIARFIREGEALRELNHPNIVKMVDAVEEDGRHYLVMEYVPGGSLRDLLEKQGRLPIERTVEIALEVADALTRAHHLGIIHRDLKPSNVLLAADGTARLTDFGIAQLASEPRLTGADRAVGTVDYMSPEACNLEPLDRRTDVWSFGVMLYEMLAGERPFAGDSPLTTLTAILTKPLPDLQRLCPDASDALVDLVYRMLEKDPAARIPSVRLAGAELETMLEAVSGQSSAVSSQLSAISVQQSAISGQAPTTASRFATPTPPAEAPRHNLPIQPTPFVGREAELGELERLLSDPSVRLVSVLGAGGMGKTRLALEAAERQAKQAPLDRFTHGVYFASLAPLQSTDAIVPTIAKALSFSFYEGGAPRQQLLDYLREKRMLLLLDNWEHLLVGVDIVADILTTAPNVKVLVTSRARLSVQGEQLYHLAGMDFPDWETPEDALDYSAVKLFLQSARRVRSDFELEAGDLQYVSRICRLVGGMPLGILLAAAWIEMLTPAEIAAEIERSLDFLEDSSRDMPERQRSVRAVFDHSWNLLTEREVFAGLSVFRSGFTRDAAQQVTHASLRELRSLVDKSLLHRAPTGRYEMHELLRQYAGEKLDRSPDAGQAVRDRHSAYYAAALQKWAADLKGPRQQTALAEMDADVENARAAWDWAVERGQVEQLDQAIDGLGAFYDFRVRYQDGQAACQLAAEKLLPTASGDGLRVRAKILAWQGCFEIELDRRELARQLLEQSLALLDGPELEDRDTRSERAFALRQMGHLVRRSDREEARQLYEQSLALYQSLGDRWFTARTLASLGSLAWNVGDSGKAKQLYQQSLAIQQSLGDQRGIAGSFQVLGGIAVFRGQVEEGERLKRESMAVFREMGDRVLIAGGLGGFGATLYRAGGKYTEAHLLLDECLAISGDLGLRGASIASPTMERSGAKVHLGRYKQARAQARISLALSREVDYRFGIGGSLVILSSVALAEEAYTEAQALLQEGIATYRTIGQCAELSWALAHLGYVARGLGQLPQARQYISEALRIATGTEEFWPPVYVLPALALLLVDRGEVERAVELYGLASRYPHVANSRWFEDVAGRHIAAAATVLPPDAVAAAQERGRARDLWDTVKELLAELAG